MKNTSVAHYFNLYHDSEIVFYTVIVELVKISYIACLNLFKPNYNFIN